jgi:hypothetical protein
MSLRLRPRVHTAQPTIAWPETLSVLAEVHRARRSADESSRWPLAHACTGHARAAASTTDAGPESGLGGHHRSSQPFCCRALA